MATHTLGTNANNSLTSMTFQKGGLLPADIASIAQGIKSDGVQNDALNADIGKGGIVPGAWDTYGRLFIPYRGVLLMLPGDVVAVDSQGWPILVSANSIANGPWTFV